MKLVILAVCLAISVVSARNVVTMKGARGPIRVGMAMPETERMQGDEAKNATKNDTSRQIYSLHVVSQIQSRFATTQVTSKIANRHDDDNEVAFIVQLPDPAFISNFSMKIDGKVIVGEVKEKEEAKQDYDAARRRGESAGHVAQSPRETNTFRISVNVAKKSKVVMVLTYQEVLKRTHGAYKHIVNVNPGQVVDDLKVDVFVEERTEITRLLAPDFGPKIGEMTNKDLLKLPPSKLVQTKSAIGADYSHVQFSYHPTREQQGGEGLKGQMVILYDVKRNAGGGELMVVNGYFVHFFAPEGLPVASKHVVFVLDKSGSMMGRKIAQTKEAMKVILRDLNDEDYFNIITFSNNVHFWRNASVAVNNNTIREATVFVDGTEATGGTDIDGAMVAALQHISSPNSPKTLTPAVIFMTDGQPTSGETNRDKIIEHVLEANVEGETVVHSIGFGNNVDFKLLKKMSLLNHGVARKVYEDSDAALQLAGFYAEVSSPLLKNVKIRYLNETADPDSLLLEHKYTVYEGGEVMVLGKLSESVYENPKKSISLDVNESVDLAESPEPEAKVMKAEVEGTGSDGPTRLRIICTLPPPCFRPGPCPPWPPRPIPSIPVTTPSPLPAHTVGGFVERMWAYQTIKKLLEKEKYLEDDKNQKKLLKEKALQMSLKYNFVTELTSMVVIQPNQTNSTLGFEEEKPEIAADFGGRTSNYFMSHRVRGGSARMGGLSGLPGSPGRPGMRGGPGMMLPPPMPTHHARPPTSTYHPTTTTTPIPTTTPGVCDGKPHALPIRCEELTNSTNTNWLQMRINNGVDIGDDFNCAHTPVVCGCERNFVFVPDLNLDLIDESGCRRLANEPKTADERLVGPCAGQCEPTCDEPTPICGRACLRHSHAYVCKDGFVRNQEGNCVALDDCVDDEIFFF